MRSRIVTLTTLAAVLAIGLFGIPLAVGVERYYHADKRAELMGLANSAALSIADDVIHKRSLDNMPGSTADALLGLYSPAGKLVNGQGPAQLEGALAAARGGQPATVDIGADTVAAVAITDDGVAEGIVRAASPRSEVLRRTAWTWLMMLGLGVVAIGANWLVVRSQARRLTLPLERLSTTAHRLGEGDFTARAGTVGVPEIDAVGEALDVTARRLGEVLARERAFSADASHQLRTPLAGFRLQLEAAAESPTIDAQAVIDAGIAAVDRLERTIDDLLSLARDVGTSAELVSVESLLAEVRKDWRDILAAQGRALRVVIEPDVAGAHVPAPVLRQVMLVLMDNAMRHGLGTVTVDARDAGDTLAFDVTDEGPGVVAGRDDIFRRRSQAASGHGIGLALARSLVEAEGGRLWLSTPTPPTFTLLLPLRPEPSAPDPNDAPGVPVAAVHDYGE